MRCVQTNSCMQLATFASLWFKYNCNKAHLTFIQFSGIVLGNYIHSIRMRYAHNKMLQSSCAHSVKKLNSQNFYNIFRVVLFNSSKSISTNNFFLKFEVKNDEFFYLNIFLYALSKLRFNLHTAYLIVSSTCK